MEQGDLVEITGVFGDGWLHQLFGSAIGPSPAPYRMPGVINSKTIEGYMVEGKKRVWDGMVSRHSDGSKCQCHPCDATHTREYEVEWKSTMAFVPSYAVKPRKE